MQADRPFEEGYECEENQAKMLKINNNTSTTELEEGKVMAVTHETIRKFNNDEFLSDLISEDNEAALEDQLEYIDNGSKKKSIKDAKLILDNDPQLRGALTYNKLTRRRILHHSVPWRVVDEPTCWTDSDTDHLQLYLEEKFGFTGSERNLMKAVGIIMDDNSYHPIKDYIDCLSWDGKERINTILVDYLGAEDTEYTRAVGRKWLTAAIARIKDPGCKFDNMLILVGKQGIGKSQFFERLARKREWFSDSVTKANNSKDSMEQLAGKWIIEFGELSALSTSKADPMKAFLTRTVDSYRPSYGREQKDFKRQCIFGGSTNRDEFLNDPTGNRRFWPVKVNDTSRMRKEMTPETVDQIWAEAFNNYSNGEKLYLNQDIELLARKEQELYTEIDGRVGIVAEFLERRLPNNWDSKGVRAKQEWLRSNNPFCTEGKQRNMISNVELHVECFGGTKENYNKKKGQEYSAIMQQLKWTTLKRQRIFEYGQQRCYCMPTALPSGLESDLLDSQMNESVDLDGYVETETNVQKPKKIYTFKEVIEMASQRKNKE